MSTQGIAGNYCNRIGFPLKRGFYNCVEKKKKKKISEICITHVVARGALLREVETVLSFFNRWTAVDRGRVRQFIIIVCHGVIRATRRPHLQSLYQH